MQRTESDQELDVLEGWRAGRQEWPGVEVTREELGEYLRERAGAVHVRDLYLACACARGDRAALRIFEETFLPEVQAAAGKLGVSAVVADEARQVLRQRLFVGLDGRPKILEFSGRGGLRSWVRIAATRIVLNVASRKGRERPWGGNELAAVIGGGADPEVQYLKRHYRAHFKDAFTAAFDALEDRERNLLRYAFGDGLSVDAIGTVYGVHRATAARWVARAQANLTKRLRTSLKEHLGLRSRELASILRLIESQIEVTLRRATSRCP